MLQDKPKDTDVPFSKFRVVRLIRLFVATSVRKALTKITEGTRMPILQEKPNSSLASQFPPGNGRGVKVQTGDNWKSIADNNGLKTWDQIEFNFPAVKETASISRKCKQVNWLMRAHVKSTQTDDGKNYRFDSLDSPGYVYVPKTPLPPTEPRPHKYMTPGHSRRYKQPSGNLCWGSAVASIYDWKKNKPYRRALDALTEIGLEWGIIYSTGRYLSGPAFKKLAKDAGLRSHKTGKFLVDDYWINVIRSRGQMLMLQYVHGMWTHWLVIVGYEVEADGKLRLRYMDPGDGALHWETADMMYSKLLDARTQVAKVWSF